MEFLYLFLPLMSLLVKSSPTPKVTSSTTNGFSCVGQLPGYYADIFSGCQKYHLCSVGGKQWTYSCPEGTLFQQRMTVCDHQHNVDCGSTISSAPARHHPNQLSAAPQENYVLPSRHSGSDSGVEKSPQVNKNHPTTAAPLHDTPLLNFLEPVKKITSIHVSVSPIFDIEPTFQRPSYFPKAQTTKQLTQLSSAEQVEAKSSERRSVLVGIGFKSLKPVFPERELKPAKQRNVVIIKEPSSMNQEDFTSESPYSEEDEEVAENQREGKSFTDPNAEESRRKEDVEASKSRNKSEVTSSEEGIVAEDRPLGGRSVGLEGDITAEDRSFGQRSVGLEDDIVAGDRSIGQRSVGLDAGRPSRLEWTLPDVRAMLYIPDREEDAVEPNIKRYSVTVPSKRHTQNVMKFRSTVCPDYCDVRFLTPGLCTPCLPIK